MAGRVRGFSSHRQFPPFPCVFDYTLPNLHLGRFKWYVISASTNTHSPYFLNGIGQLPLRGPKSWMAGDHNGPSPEILGSTHSAGRSPLPIPDWLNPFPPRVFSISKGFLAAVKAYRFPIRRGRDPLEVLFSSVPKPISFKESLFSLILSRQRVVFFFPFSVVRLALSLMHPLFSFV